MEALVRHASQLYAAAYFGMIITVSSLERVIPRRDVGDTLRLRWLNNIAMTILDTIVVRLIFPVLGLGLSILCADRGWGLLNHISLPVGFEIVLTLIAMDFMIYLQHFLLHHVSVLWKLHRMHHTDQNFDFTTGLRFHPLESLFTTGAGLAVIIALGPPPVAVLIAQLVFVVDALIGHGNFRVPGFLDRSLRYLLVTPDMHRIHHSEELSESQSNFGNVFSFWDRLFRTYRDQPAAAHEVMTMGVADFRERKHLTLPWMLIQPCLQENQDRFKTSALSRGL